MAKTYRDRTLYRDVGRVLRRAEHVKAVQEKHAARCASRYDLRCEAEEAMDQQRRVVAQGV